MADRHPNVMALPPVVVARLRRMVRDTRAEHGRTPLTPAETRWLEHRAQEQARQADRPSRSLLSRIQKATDRWSEDAGWIAVGLEHATVTLPPASRPGGGRTPGPSDPTAAQLHATLAELDRAVVKFAHLTGTCDRDGLRFDPDGNETPTGRLHECPDGTPADIADLTGLVLDPEEIVDSLLGTPPTSTRAFTDAVHGAASWHTKTAADLRDRWQTAWQQGAEPALLETWTAATEQLARRITHLAGELAGWSGRFEATCNTCGGLKPAGRADCGRCRTAAWRQRNTS